MHLRWQRKPLPKTLPKLFLALRKKMNLARFISNRILSSDDKGRISRPIVRIATIGIAIGVALMIISVAIVKGFQYEIREKVIGFGSHFQVVSNERNYSQDSKRLLYSEEVFQKLKNTPGVRHVQTFATKPGILETDEALQGIVIKGVDHQFDWTFLRSMMKEGKILSDSSERYDILISEYIANRLKLSLGQKVSLYFFNEEADPRQRNFTIRGIYNTGLEDFDKQFVFIDLSHVQRLAGWGIRLEAQADTQCVAGMIPVGAYAFGGSGSYDYEWSDASWDGEGPHFLITDKDTTIWVVATDNGGTIPDTSWIHINYLDDESTEPCRPYEITIESTDSDSKYIGGYEILIESYDRLMDTDDALFGQLTADFLQTQKITDRNPEIFAWLEMLDINVVIIILLMIIISVVNMTSALLILILERQNMIGTLKALGIRNNTVMQIFLRNAAAIIGKGVIYGNFIGIGYILLQKKFKLIRLNPANYYVDSVPVLFDWQQIILLNVIVLVICIAFMIIPAQYVSRISPIKSIRFS